MNHDTAMEFIHYAQNITLTVLGLATALECIIRSSREDYIAGNFIFSSIGYIGASVGLWNLICLLEKLNVIQP